MISYHKGDLLTSGCNIICHQVNLQGVMGGGLALQIATKYPQVESKYHEKYKLYQGGEVLFATDETSPIIANCFSQNEDFTTNYQWVRECAEQVRRFAIAYNKKTIGIPKNYGCGIATGDWETVKQIWSDVFKDILDLQIWSLND